MFLLGHLQKISATVEFFTAMGKECWCSKLFFYMNSLLGRHFFKVLFSIFVTVNLNKPVGKQLLCLAACSFFSCTPLYLQVFTSFITHWQLKCFWCYFVLVIF